MGGKGEGRLPFRKKVAGFKYQRSLAIQNSLRNGEAQNLYVLAPPTQSARINHAVSNASDETAWLPCTQIQLRAYSTAFPLFPTCFILPNSHYRRRCFRLGMCRSASRAIFSIAATASTGYWPSAVSSESMIASDPHTTA